MATGEALLLALAVALALYLLVLAVLLAAGRRTDARAWAGFVPDCVVLVRRLLGDPRVPRRRKAVLGAVALYLAMPFDLVPDVVPVLGQLDDALVLALALRHVLRGTPGDLLGEHWPGPERSLRVVRGLSA
jgi:uncharacterized membrane protein YkvA (DUF1232 family)